MSRDSPLSSLTLGAALLLVFAGRPSRADEGDAAALLTLEGEAALRDRLAERVVLLSVTSRAHPHQDAELAPRRFGQAVRARLDGKPALVTALAAVEESAAIELSRAGVPGVAPAVVVERRSASGLATLLCGERCGPVKDAPVVEAAPPGACGPGRILFFVAPAGEAGLVLGHTIVTGKGEPTLPDLAVVGGQLPDGTPLFDSEGRLAAMAVRQLQASPARTLVTSFSPPAAPPEPPPSGADGPEHASP